MIPRDYVQQWREQVNWRNVVQVEQDLIISRALVDLYNDSHIKDSLVFRGGTALNKLFLKPQARYSEDIDFVQKRVEPIGATLDTIRKLLKPWLGDPAWSITRRGAKMFYKYRSIDEAPGRLKIEINTMENFQVCPLKTTSFQVDSKWFQGSANITTYEIDELMATKLRALYQRRKGRDLFDVWHVASQGLVNVENMIDIFRGYCAKDGIMISGAEFISNLKQKKNHPDFCVDMHALLPDGLNWDFDEAYQFVIDNIVSNLS